MIYHLSDLKTKMLSIM